jgi:TatD DNase family protein
VFDTHCHLQALEDAAAAIARARAAGVEHMLLAGVAPDSWARDDALAAEHDGLWISYGLHPQLVATLSDDQCDSALVALDEKLAHRGPRVVAVGEIGLDAVDERRHSLERQERVFVAQLGLARKHGLPVALHVLRAHPRALELLARTPPRGVLHSCSASPELTQKYVALGLHVSFSGSITWHGGDNRAARAVEVVPRDRLVVETDAPDQTPEPHRSRLSAQARGGTNEPAFLVAIVAAVAHIWGVQFAEAERITDDNARRLFNV